MKTDKAHLDVTLDDVVAAATTLQDERQRVTIEAVRARIGAGSARAIQRHLAAWRASQAQAPDAPDAPSAELPPALLADLGRWARQFADDAGAGTRDALARLEADMDSLLAASEELDAELNETRSARERAQLIADERNEEIDRLTAELRNARQVAADALVGKAKDQLAIDGKDAQLADLRQQLERNVAATAAESDARLRAQMELVGVTTERDNLAAEVKELRTRLDTSRTERSNLRAELETLRTRK